MTPLIKKCVLFVSLLSVTTAYSQQFNLPVPKDWKTESFTLPVDFAPNIPYAGVEELRFSPGWGTPGSEELWSYCFLWWIEGDVAITASNLKNHLEDYFGGLVNRNITNRKIESAKVVPTRAKFRQMTNTSGNYFVGTVSMLDYMSQKPIVLNIKVQKTYCKAQNREAVFFSVSPQPQDHRLWKEFGNIWAGFACNN